MSDQLKHECGIGLIRLFRPLSWYQENHGSALWGMRRMYLLMEKMRNRGQDGAGFGCVKLETPPGLPYHARIRDNSSSSLSNLFKRIDERLLQLKADFPNENHLDTEFLKRNYEFAGEVMMGHLRYGTHGGNSIDACHPVSRINNWRNRSLMVAGNFNMTNVGELVQKLVELGQHPRHLTDTETVLEKIGHFLDKENEELYALMKPSGKPDTEIARIISEELDMRKIFEKSAVAWDGGYVIGGIVGNGDTFIARDPRGIRPAYYYHNQDFFVAASERAAIATVFHLSPDEIQEVPPGYIITVKADTNEVRKEAFCPQEPLNQCSFERIYFSRGNDPKIYKERKLLGKEVTPKVMEAMNNDFENTVFSFIPNTAEIAFQGLSDELHIQLDRQKAQILASLEKPSLEMLSSILEKHPRIEKVVYKDVKMRTFIADNDSRNDLVSHVYDITHDILVPNRDTLVVMDDSIVRGTTLQQSILVMLARLKPKKVIIVSSAPQIRYPDCYGIDMSQIQKLVAFQAAIELLHERNLDYVKHRTYAGIKELEQKGEMDKINLVKEIYAPFSEDEISAKITELLRPKDYVPELQIIYQPLENLRKAIPNHTGDWYFSGNYPTPGGNRVANQAFLNFYENKNVRAYQMNLGS